MNISLRSRIALWYAVAITVLVFALAFAAQQIMVLALRNSLEEALIGRGETMITAITANLETERESYDDVLGRLTEQRFRSVPLLLRIASSQGAIGAEFGDIPTPIIPRLNELLRQPHTSDGRFDTIRIRGVEALIVYTIPVPHPTTGRTIAVVQAAESLTPVTAAQTRLWRFTLLLGVLGSLVTVTISLLLLRQGFRPLDRILGRVQGIEGGSLRELLPDESRPPELQRLAESLNSMWARLYAEFRAKEMFVASVSHELRTPLTALAGHIDILLMQPVLHVETRESLERMAQETRRLVRMTNNLLLNAQLETGPTVTMEAVNLRDIVEDVLGDLWVLAEGIDLNLTAQEDILIAGDQDLIKQFVLNIVDNAIKFTPTGGSVGLHLSAEERWAVLEIADTGQGIPNQHLPHIMDAFYKVDSKKGSVGTGAGLGLAIVKQIVDLHKGEIDISSQEGVGTTVCVRLLVYTGAHAQEATLDRQSETRLGS